MPEAPNRLCVIGLDAGDGYTQHYFDSRGIARLYAMTFDGREWTLERHAPDFLPARLHQRWLGTFSADGNTIAGRSETSPDGRDWELDFGAHLPPRQGRRDAPGWEGMATFVLIHGAGDNSWYWHLVEPEPRAGGHDVVAPRPSLRGRQGAH